MKKFLGVSMSLLLACNISMTTVAHAKTNNDQKKKVEEQLEDSQMTKQLHIKEVRELYDKIKNTAVDATKSDTYVRISSDAERTKKVFTEEEYKREIAKEDSSTYKVPSNSGNRYSWIKLTLEAYNFGNNDFMFCGFWEWKTAPMFRGKDVITLGHDSNILFDIDGSFAVNMVEFYQPGHNQPTVQSQMIEMNNDKKNTLSDVNGVGFKFGLFKTPDMYPNKHTGSVYCNGKLSSTNSTGGNLQVSYGHSELALDYKISDAVKFLANGSIDFNVTGTKDLATHGDAVYK